MPQDEATSLAPTSSTSTVVRSSRSSIAVGVSLLVVGVLAVGASDAISGLLWTGGPVGLGVVRAALALGLAFVIGPVVLLLLLQAFLLLSERRR